MNREKCALLVIDMQLVAFDGKITPPIAEGQELVKTIAELIGVCRSTDAPIVFVQTCALSGQAYAKDMHGWEIHPELTPANTDSVVYKVHSNGFEDTNLQDVLTKIGVDTLITCGIWSEFCVTATSRAALDLGYRVWLATDGHGTAAYSDDEARRIVAKQNDELTRLSALTIDVQEIRAKLTAP